MYIDLKFVSIFQVFHEHDDGSSDYDIEHENLLERQFGTLMLDANPNFQIASSEKLNWVLAHLLLHPPTLLISGYYQAHPYHWTLLSRAGMKLYGGGIFQKSVVSQ